MARQARGRGDRRGLPGERVSAGVATARRRTRVTARTRVDVWRLAPLTAAAIGAAVYLAINPHTVDLAAHVYRTNLFDREGFTIWNGGWGGRGHTPADCVRFPAIPGLLGPH